MAVWAHSSARVTEINLCPGGSKRDVNHRFIWQHEPSHVEEKYEGVASVFFLSLERSERWHGAALPVTKRSEVMLLFRFSRAPLQT